MAFLCPVRLGRGKKKKSVSGDGDKEVSRPGSGLSPGMGRITGSASIETLVRVGIEKEHGLSPDSKMVVLHDFAPCVDDELEVKRGQVVNILYRENDWVYVILADSRQEGFIPHSYCAPYSPHLLPDLKKKLPRASSDLTNQDSAHTGNESRSEAGSESDGCPFSKAPSGRCIVLYTFQARDENDVPVERGEFVTVLNREDPDWFWVVRSNGQEGFIPSGFVYPADNVVQGGNPNSGVNNNNNNLINSNNNMSNVNSTSNPNITSVNSNNNINTCDVGQPATQQQAQQPQQEPDPRYHGTELVMLYDYKAQAPDDLSVRRGEWVYADLLHQTVEGWLWAHAPKTRRYGFIPKAYARPPATTSL